jgi:D-alanyl-D-alanine carboxypeptidase
VAVACKTILTAVFAALLLAAPAVAREKNASMVIDADTGEVLHASNVDSRTYPASLTKMMTLYLLFDDLESGKVHLSDRMPVSKHAAVQAPSKLGLMPKHSVTLEDAMLGLVTKSANDAAVVIAEYLAGSEPAFAQRMTRKAHELGMNKTTFKNANGLPNAEQMTTARDMATLARALIHNHAKHYHYFSTREFTYKGQVIPNHNHLLDSYDGADGIKTGYIDASGFNLVASAKRDGRRLIGVVFGGQTAGARDRLMARLLDAGFERTPGSSGVELAELPEQADADELPAKVLKAMARGKVAIAKAAAAQKEAAGDAEDDWAIELGAFSQSTKARQLADATMAKLGKLASDGEATATGLKKGRQLVYHARITGLSRDDARQACHALAKHHHNCKALNLG